MTENRKVNRYHPYKRPDAHEVSIRRRFFVKYHQNVRLIFEPRLTTSMLNMQTMEYMTLSDDLFMKVIDFVSCAKLHIDRHSGLRILARFTYLEFQRRKRRFHPYKRPENLKYIKSQLVWTECIKASLVELGEMKQKHNQEYKSSSVTEMKKITAEINQNSPDVSEILPTKGEDITTQEKNKADEIVEHALSSDDISAPVQISKKSPVVPETLLAKNKDITTHETMKDENDVQLPSHDIKTADDIQSNEDNCSSQKDYRNPLLLTKNDSIQIQEQANASSIDLSSSTLGNNHNDSTTEIVPLSETLSSELTVYMDNGSSQKNRVDNDKSTREPINEENESSDTPKQTDSSTHLSTNEDSDSEIDSETEEALLRIGSDESDCDLGIKESEAERTTSNSTELDELHHETATGDDIELEEFFTQIDEFLEEVGFKQCDVISESENKTIITEETLTLNDTHTNNSSDQIEDVHPTTDNTICVERDVKTSKGVDMATQSLLTNNGLEHSNTRCETVMTLSIHSDNTRNDVEPKTSIIPCGTDSFQSDERKRIDIHMSASMDDHQQALKEALSSGLTAVEPLKAVEPGTTHSVTNREKSENKERPEKACLHGNHQERQQLGEIKLSSSQELSTGDHTIPSSSEDSYSEVIKKEMPKDMEPKVTDQAVSIEMKNDLTELFKPIQMKPELSKQAKPIEIKPEMPEQAKSIEIKQAMLKDEKTKLPIQSKPKNVKPALPKLLKLSDINLELAQLIKLNDIKPKIVKQTRPNSLKTELAKQTKQTDVKVELSRLEKPKVIKQELFNQAQARDIKQLSKQAEPKQAKPKEIKQEWSKRTKMVEIKQELSDQAKSKDIKLEATKEARLSDAKQELLKQTNPIDIKSELIKQSKLNDIKAELPRQTRPNGVHLEVTKQTKPNDVIKFEEKKKPKFVPIPIKYDINDKPSGVEGKVKQEIVTTEEKDKFTVNRKVLPPKQKYKPEPRSIVEHNKSKVKAVTTKPKYRPNPVISAQVLKASAEQCVEAQNKKFKPVPIVFREEKKTGSEATMPGSERFKPKPIKTPEKKETEVTASKHKHKPVTFTFGEVKKPKKDKDIEASAPKYQDIQLKLGQESKTSVLTETKVQKRKFMPTPIIFSDDGHRKVDKVSVEQQVEAVAPKRKFKPTPITFGDGEHRKELCSEALPPKPKFKPTPITFGKDVSNKFDKFSQDGCATGVVQTPKPKFKPTPILFESKGLRKIAKSSQEEHVEYRKRRFASCLDDTGPRKLKLRY